jgi:hypothetical protein
MRMLGRRTALASTGCFCLEYSMHLASVLQERRKSANIRARSGVAFGIPNQLGSGRLTDWLVGGNRSPRATTALMGVRPCLTCNKQQRICSWNGGQTGGLRYRPS